MQHIPFAQDPFIVRDQGVWQLAVLLAHTAKPIPVERTNRTRELAVASHASERMNAPKSRSLSAKIVVVILLRDIALLLTVLHFYSEGSRCHHTTGWHDERGR